MDVVYHFSNNFRIEHYKLGKGRITGLLHEKIVALFLI